MKNILFIVNKAMVGGMIAHVIASSNLVSNIHIGAITSDCAWSTRDINVFERNA